MFKKDVDMLKGPIIKGLLALSIPIMIMNVTQSLFNIIDMAILGKSASDTAVGAVGTTGTLISLTTGLLIGLSTGANVVVAKRIGENNKKNLEKAVSTSIMLGFASGILLFLIGMLFAEPILSLINCPAEILPSATLYFRLYFIGVPFLMMYNFCASLLRASGDTRSPMLYLMISGVIKVLLNVVFVAWLKLDVLGVGLATIISFTLAGTLLFRAVNKNKETLPFEIKKLKFYASEVKSILYVGVPTGVQTALYSFANTVIAATVNTFGANATTGISIANQFDGILYQIACAPAVAVTPYVAQNVGARNLERVKKAIRSAIFITVTFGASFGALSAIFSGQLSSIMSTTPEVIMYSRQKMMLISSTYFICGINEGMCGVLRGLGKPIIPTISIFMWMCVFRFIWVYGIYPFFPHNLTFLYLVWPVGWILSITTLVIAFIPTIRNLAKKFKTEEIEKAE